MFMRNYRKEYDNYHSRPEQKLRRAARNAARRSLKDVPEDKDVHHKDNNPLNNDKNNLSVVTQHYNRKEPRLREKKLKLRNEDMGTVTGPHIAGTGDDSSTVVVRKKKNAAVQKRQKQLLKDRIKSLARQWKK
jgi:hypothetical protein